MQNKNFFKKSSFLFSLLGLGFLIAGFSGCFKSGKPCAHCDEPKTLPLGIEKSTQTDDSDKKDIVLSTTESSSESVTIASFDKELTIPLKLNLKLPKNISQSDIEDTISAIVGPMMKISMGQLPLAQRTMIVKDIVKSKAVVRDVATAALKDQKFVTEFVKALEGTFEIMALQWFHKQIESQIKVSPQDIAEEFENNKSRYISEMGGVHTLGVKFKSYEEADDFEKNVLTKNALKEESFTKLARTSSGLFRDFKWVSKEFSRGIDEEVLSTVEDLKRVNTFPIIEKVEASGDETWVLLALNKRETSYIPEKDRTAKIEEAIRARESYKILQEKTEEIKSKSNVSIDLNKVENISTNDSSPDDDDKSSSDDYNKDINSLIEEESDTDVLMENAAPAANTALV